MVPIDTMLQKGPSPYQKYHLTKIAPNINGTSRNGTQHNWHGTLLLLLLLELTKMCALRVNVGGVSDVF